MFQTFFTIFFLLHLLGDFYLQTNMLARKKETSYRFTLLHCLIYAIPFAVFPLLVSQPWSMVTPVLVLIGSHFIIDTVKFFLQRSGRFSKTRLYVVDQLLHILTLAALAFWCGWQFVVLEPNFWINALLFTAGISGQTALIWLTMLLALAKPANITIKQLVGQYKPQEQEEVIVNAGAAIGTLERIIMLLLLGAGQYAAIALVLTAKSIARYEMLKDKDFAEYYLLGTLLSILCVLVLFLGLAR